MLKKILVLPLLFIVSCYAPNIPDKITEVSLTEKAKVSLGEYSSVFINEHGNGFITWPSQFTGARRVEDYKLTGEDFKLGNDFGSSKIYLDSNGDGIIVWYSYPVGLWSTKTFLYGRTIKNYQPVGEEVVINNKFGSVRLSPKIKIDEKGNGLIAWIKDYRNKDDFLYSTQIKDFKILTESTKKENITSLLYYIKEENGSFNIREVTQIPDTETINESQLNGFNPDNGGNGIITRLEDAIVPITQTTPQNNPDSEEQPSPIGNSGEGIQPPKTIKNLMIRKVVNYKLQDEEIKLADNVSYYYQVETDKNGDGLVIWIDEKSNILRQNLKNFTSEGEAKIIEKGNISYGYNPYFHFNKTGKGILTWSESDSRNRYIYARQIEK